MVKKKSTILSFALAFLLLLSAPLALVFGKTAATTARAATLTATDQLTANIIVSDPQSGSNAKKTAPATIEAGLNEALASKANQGIIAPILKVGDYAQSMEIDISTLTKDTVLLEWYAGGNTDYRSPRIQIIDAANAGNYIDLVYVRSGLNNSAFNGATPIQSAATANANVSEFYVKAVGTTSSNATYTTAYTSGPTGKPNSADAAIYPGAYVPAFYSTALTGGPGLTTPQRIYYDASEKAIYADVVKSLDDLTVERQLIRDLDAVDATNGNDTAWSGFSGNKVYIKLQHHTGGGANYYSYFITKFNGMDLSFNASGLLNQGHLLDADGLVSGLSTYKNGSDVTNVFIGSAVQVPSTIEVEGGEPESTSGWTAQVVRPDSTVDPVEGGSFAAEEGVNRLVLTKEEGGKTAVVTYLYQGNPSLNLDVSKIMPIQGTPNATYTVQANEDHLYVPMNKFDAAGGAGNLDDDNTANDPDVIQNNGGVKSMVIDISDNTKDDVLLDFQVKANRVYKVIITDGAKSITLYFANPNNKASTDWLGGTRGEVPSGYTAANIGQLLVEADGLSTKGGLDYVLNTNEGAPTAFTTAGTIVPKQNSAETHYKVYYDATEKAIYADIVLNGQDGLYKVEKQLIRNLGASDFTNNNEAAWAGFNSNNVTISVQSKGGGGGADNHSMWLYELDGIKMNSVDGNLVGSYKTVDNAAVTKGGYKPLATVTVPVGESYVMPSIYALDSDTPDSGWTLEKVTNASGEVTVTGNDFTPLAGANYVIYQKAIGADAEKIACVVNGANFYDVSFDIAGGDGTAPDTQSVIEGGKATAPTDPTKTGFKFMGWLNGTDPYDFNSAVTQAVSLTASWKEYFTVTFNLDGGNIADDTNNPTVEVLDGDAIATAQFPATNPQKTGYRFDGWDYVDGTAIEQDTTVDAKWVQQVTVTFNSNEGSAVTAQTIDVNTAATEPTDPEKTGYDFAYWYTTDEDVAYEFTTPVTGALTLNAKWTIKTYAVTFTDGVASQTIDHGAQATEPTDPTKTGYTFDYWYTTDEDVAYVFTTPVTGALALTAKWTVVTYNLTYTGVEGATNTNPATYDVTMWGAALVDASKDGYNFVGWFVEGQDDPVELLPNGMTGDIELEARWQIKTYTVTFSDGVAAQTINHGEKAVAPTAPTKSGYEFGGWYVGNVAYDFNSAVTANVELTAKWTAVTPETPDEPTTPSEPTTPDAPEKKDGCAKEAAGMLAVVLTALAAALVIKRK